VQPGATSPAPELPEFTCPVCGAHTSYEPGTTMMRCSRCGAEHQIAAAGHTIVEHSYDDWAALPPKPVATIGKIVLQCQTCGATIETDMLADTCRFCRGPLVAVQNPDRLIAPEAVVPFGLDQTKANAAFNTWVRSRRFAPGALKKVGSTDSITGTYIPHWTYDAQTDTDYAGQRGEYYYVTVPVTVSDGQGHMRTEYRQERRTHWYAASGHVARPFDDVLVPASHRLPSETLQKMGPWTLGSAAAYQPDYLAGYAALRYDLDPDAGLTVAHGEMSDVIQGDCRADIGGDEQRVDTMNIRYAATMFKLVLLPLWIASYLYAGTTFQVLVNANTGEVIGDRPYSKVKIAAAIVAGLVVIAAIIVAVVLAKKHGS
jgi:Zn finger protein HypA/HybF involved in hydrogenase expression